MCQFCNTLSSQQSGLPPRPSLGAASTSVLQIASSTSPGEGMQKKEEQVGILPHESWWDGLREEHGYWATFSLISKFAKNQNHQPLRACQPPQRLLYSDLPKTQRSFGEAPLHFPSPTTWCLTFTWSLKTWSPFDYMLRFISKNTISSTGFSTCLHIWWWPPWACTLQSPPSSRQSQSQSCSSWSDPCTFVTKSDIIETCLRLKIHQIRAVLMQLQSGGTSDTSTVATVKWPKSCWSWKSKKMTLVWNRNQPVSRFQTSANCLPERENKITFGLKKKELRTRSSFLNFTHCSRLGVNISVNVEMSRYIGGHFHSFRIQVSKGEEEG